jgi:hypothetical protein
MWLVGLYLGIGVLVAIVHLAQGKVGAVGPLGTFLPQPSLGPGSSTWRTASQRRRSAG